jgi:hypothetical protein
MLPSIPPRRNGAAVQQNCNADVNKVLFKSFQQESGEPSNQKIDDREDANSFSAQLKTSCPEEQHHKNQVVS